jgi:hypothetical protein
MKPAPAMTLFKGDIDSKIHSFKDSRATAAGIVGRIEAIETLGTTGTCNDVLPGL